MHRLSSIRNSHRHNRRSSAGNSVAGIGDRAVQRRQGEIEGVGTVKYLVVIAIATALAACAGQPLSQQEAALIQAQMQQQTLTVDCPAGCLVSYRDPRDTVQIPRHTNGWDAAISLGQSVERVATGAVPVIGMGYMGAKAIKALQGSGAVTTTTSTNTDVVDYSGSVGDYSGQGAGNAGSLISDNTGRIASPNDSTHRPAIVEQPAPVIVNGGAP